MFLWDLDGYTRKPQQKHTDDISTMVQQKVDRGGGFKMHQIKAYEILLNVGGILNVTLQIIKHLKSKPYLFLDIDTSSSGTER